MLTDTGQESMGAMRVKLFKITAIVMIKMQMQNPVKHNTLLNIAETVVLTMTVVVAQAGKPIVIKDLILTLEGLTLEDLGS